MARDATARLYDVHSDSVKLIKRRRGDIRDGLVIFEAKKDKLVSLDKLHESIWATRLSGRTGMRLNRLVVTAVGEVVVEETKTLLKVKGSKERFVLIEPRSKSTAKEKSALDKLHEAVARGAKVVHVTGRVSGWSGPFPALLKKLPEKPRRIIVEEFAAETDEAGASDKND